jgi:hypothetical protein
MPSVWVFLWLEIGIRTLERAEPTGRQHQKGNQKPGRQTEPGEL